MIDQLPAKMRGKIRVEYIDGCPVPGPCWVWAAGRTTGGYGVVRLDSKTKYTHRVSHEVFIGPIPAGLQTDHLCRNRACCNPTHLEAVTPRVNVLRGAIAQKTHCANGHPLSGDNLVWSKGDRHRHRRCRTCFNESHRESRKRHGAKWNAAKRARYQPRRDPALCGNGHEWSESNTRITPAGYRLCRQCERDRKSRWREHRRAREAVAA